MTIPRHFRWQGNSNSSPHSLFVCASLLDRLVSSVQRWLSILVTAILAWPISAATADNVALIRIEGPIGPATAGYIGRAIDVAAALQAHCLIIELDTPGGLLDSTRTIIQSLYASPVPTVVYVAPAPAGAISAGCFITLAADVAAMAPNTTIGAAHPVALGGGAGEQKTDDVMSQKLLSFATSYIEAIAEKRNRNVEWAKSAVRDSASITAKTALELNVIEIIATDLSNLLEQLDGLTINTTTLHTASAEIVPIPMLLREKVFQLLWRPEVMFLLMLVAIYGIIGELSNPGAIIPGVAGAIALILALYMAAILPVNLAGAALMLLAVALFITDVLTPTHGVLTVGGIIAFFLGAFMLFDRTDHAFRLPIGLILTATVLTATFFVFIFSAGLRAQLLPIRAGRETIAGRTATTLTNVDAQGGRIFFDGEYWNARSNVPVAPGQRVEIIAMHGLTLNVKPLNKDTAP
jgi:membrane-bound serine protease (ClpP class)